MSVHVPPPHDYRKSAKQQLDYATRGRTLEMERKIQRLELIAQALWEIVCEQFQLTDQQLEDRIKAIDLRDGQEDDSISAIPLKCPTCGRVSSSKHWKCLYCGLEFERSTII